MKSVPIAIAARLGLFAATACLLLQPLVGCSTSEPQRRAQQAPGQMPMAPSQPPAAVTDPRMATMPQPGLRRDEAAFVTRASVTSGAALREEAPLPPIFESRITLQFGAEPVSLPRVARVLAGQLQVPVRLMPDLAEGAPSSSSTAAQITGAGSDKGAGAIRRMEVARAQSALDGGFAHLPRLEVNLTGSVREVLSSLAAMAGIEWSYESGEVLLSRFVTRTFLIEDLPAQSGSVPFAIGPMGGQGGGSGGGSSPSGSGSSQGQGSCEGSGGSGRDSGGGGRSSGGAEPVGSWSSLQCKVQTLLSPGASAVYSASTSSLLVRDTRATLDRVARLVEEHNAMLSRMLVLDVRVMSITTEESEDFGLAWDGVFRNILSAYPSVSLRLLSPSSVASTQGGGVVLNSSADVGSAPGSAIAQIGNARTLHAGQQLTRNNFPVTFQKARSISYVSQTTAGGTSSSGSTTVVTQPGITQSVVNTGFVFRVIPSMLPGDRILIDMVLSISNLDSLSSFTSGGQTVQSPNISYMTSQNPVILRSGEYVAFQAYEFSNDEGRRASLDPAGLLGTSSRGKSTKERMVIVMRATVANPR